MKKTIKLLTEYFYPEPASTGQLMTQLANGLIERGFNVSVYTSQPTYHGQKIKKLPVIEKYNEILIKRISATQLNKEKPIQRIVNWISFTILLFIHLLLSNRSSDILLILSNPPILPFIGLLLNWLRGQRYIIIFYDIYPDIAVKLGVVNGNSPIVKVWNQFNKILYNKASGIVVLGEKMKKILIEKAYKLNESKVKIIHNWEDSNFIKPIKKKDNPFSKKYGYDKVLTLLYSGNLAQHHDLITLINAAERLRSYPIKFVFIGDGIQKRKLQTIAKEKNLKNVDFHSYQSLDNLPVTLTCGDISVVSEDKKVNGLCLSCKIYSGLASGNTILAIVNEDSDIADIVKGCNCGFQVDQGDVEKVVECIKFWYDSKEELERMRVKARKYFEENFTFQHSLEKYVEMLNQIG